MWGVSRGNDLWRIEMADGVSEDRGVGRCGEERREFDGIECDWDKKQ